MPGKDLLREFITTRRHRDVKDQVASLIKANAPESIFAKPLRKLTQDDLETLLIGLVLRLSDAEVAKTVNEQRTERKEEPISHNLVFHYRKQYAAEIDSLYALAAMHVGEIFKYADKLFRIGRYDALASLLDGHVTSAFEGSPNEFDLKVGNLYIKVLDRLNVEMGNRPMGNIVRPPEEEGQDKLESAETTKAQIGALIDERYHKQLPRGVHSKISFSDYTVCANGEKLGETYACWNERAAHEGSCAVHLGKVKTCPKFLNRSLINDKNWLVETRRKKLNLESVARLAGCTEYDHDIRDRVAFYMKTHDVIQRVNNDSEVEDAVSRESSGEAPQ